MFNLITGFPQFLYKGYNEFCQKGFLINSKQFDKNALDVDLTDKVFIVTGGSKGLGKIVVTELAKRGGTIHLLCRGESEGQKTLEDIQNSTSNRSIYLHLVDVGNLNSLKRFVNEFNSNFKNESNEGISPLNGLIHNAGFIAEKFLKTEEGLESSFATNTLGPYYLTKLLIPNLLNTKDSRVIFVSSGGMYNTKLNSMDPQLLKSWYFNGISSYAQHKRQQIELAEHFAKIYRGKGIRFVSMHPGWCATPGVSKSLPILLSTLGESALRTPQMGADTIIWLACAKEPLDFSNGEFFFDRQPALKHLPLSNTQVSQEEVNTFISQCEALVEQALNQSNAMN